MQRSGFWLGLALFALMLALDPPTGLAMAPWRVAAVGVLMAVWWVSEAIPLSMTALAPFLLFPPLGVSAAAAVSGSYYAPVVFLVLGGSLIALAIEKSGLHRRIALAIISRSSGSLKALLLAFMIASAGLSMVVSNTATTLILMPIALSLLHVARAPGSRIPAGFGTALVLGVAYAASIGGLGTLVGSPTNAIAAGLIEKTLGLHIDFLTWAAFGLPLVAAAVPACWWWLARSNHLPALHIDLDSVRAAIGDPGSWRTAERRLLPLLIIIALAWVLTPLFRDRLGPFALDDAAIALFGALTLFLIPDGHGGRLLTWPDARGVPWDIMLMFGGGLALADAITSTGLAGWIGAQLEAAGSWPVWTVALLLTALIVLVTEFASNVAAASGFIPVVAGLALAIGFDPVLLAMPAALAASWGFMMPAGTPPNAIAFATGHVTVRQMVGTGLVINLIGVPLIVGICFAVSALMS